MKYTVWILALLIGWTAAVNAQNIGKESRVDSVLASVNGEPITLLDVLMESSREELRLSSLYSGARLYSEISQLRKRVVEDIVVRKLIYAQYLEKPFPIDNQYIERVIDQLALTLGGGSREGLVKRAEEIGTTMKELKEKSKERIAVDIMLSEHCGRPVYITPKEVFEHYEQNVKEWTTPAQYSLELLLIARSGGRSGADPKVACQKLAEQLKGADKALFAQLTKANSDAANAPQGGVVGAVDADKLRPEFAPVVLKMKAGEIAGPLETPEGYYFIRLESVKPEARIPYEKAEPEIRKQLEEKTRAQMRKAYGEQLRKQAVIRYYF
ncbi:MAG: peptidyl-prolyl cis-trans isomerase [Lentisphaeria bacterium]|nr:peptidyl-prolyl cis-trans isomerase [Lentisphaeria bacterium]